jgi:uncharacterized protein YhdP
MHDSLTPSLPQTPTGENHPQEAPQRLRRKLRRFRRFRMVSWIALLMSGLLALWVIVLALLAWVVLPRADLLFNHFATALRTQYQLELSAENIHGQLVEYKPRLHLENLRMRSLITTGADLRIKAVEVELGWELLFGKIRFYRLHLDGLQTSLWRNAAGQIAWGSTPLSNPDTTTEPNNPIASLEAFVNGLEWLFTQKRLWINNATITWRDDHEKPALRWEIGINAWLERSLFSKSVHTEINLPSEVGGKLQLDGRFSHFSAKNWTENNGELNLTMHGIQWSHLGYFLPDGEKILGSSDLSLWWRGNGMDDSRFVLQTKADNLQWQAFPLTARSAEGEIYGMIVDQKMRVDFSHFLVVTPQGKVPLPTLAELRFHDDGALSQGKIYLPSLPLTSAQAMLKSFVGWLPELQTLNAINPQGKLEHNILTVEPRQGLQPNHYHLASQLSNIRWSAFQDIPGVSGLSGTLSATPSQGHLQVDSDMVQVAVPSILYEANHGLKRLQGDIRWQINQEPSRVGDYRLQISPIRFSNEDGDLELSGYFEQQGTRPFINISATLLNGNGRNAWRYMPKSVSRDAVAWLRESIVGGQSPYTQLTLRGDLRDFPFPPAKTLSPTEKEVFQVLVPFRDARLKFQPDWPPVEDAAGLLTFTGQKMDILVTRGFLSGANAEGTRVRIDDLNHPVLSIIGTARGETPQFQDFVKYSALNTILPSLDFIMAEGAATLDLAIKLPLEGDINPQVNGQFTSEHPQLTFAPDFPPFTAVRQTTHFDQDGITQINAQGQWLDASIQLSPTPQRGQIAVFVDALSIESIANQPALHHPWMKALKGYFSAQGMLNFSTPFHASLSVNTTLLDSSLPYPLHKPAGIAWPVHINVASSPSTSAHLNNQPAWLLSTVLTIPQNVANNLPDSANASPENPMSIAVLGNWWPSIASIVKLMPQWQVNINVPTAKRLPAITAETSVDIQGRLPYFPLSDWMPWLKIIDPPKDGNATPSQTIRVSGQFSIDRLQLHDNAAQPLRAVTAQLASPLNPADPWKLAFNSDQAQGNIAWQMLTTTPSSLSVSATLARLSLDDLFASPSIPASEPMVAATPSTNPSPAIPHAIEPLPSLDLTINNTLYRDKNLGLFHLQGEPTVDGYRLREWSLKHPLASISGKGEMGFAVNKSQLDFNMDSPNLGSFLASITGKSQIDQASLAGKGIVTWPGEFTDFSLPSIQGEVGIEISKGSFLEIEPGVGRLIGLLSLQSIFRRISFDFSDSLRKGFAFDLISGNATLQGGTLHTRNLAIESPAAKIYIEGDINLHHETQNLEMLVLPDISGGLSSGVAFFVNPVAGVFTWITQKIIGSPFDYAFAKKLEVTGSWDDPQVTELPFSQSPNPYLMAPADAVSSPDIKEKYDLYRFYPDGFRAECR